jgi:lipopolysaccharide biosynthesis regulator YciM
MTAEIKKKDPSEAKSLEKMTIKELRALALEMDVPREIAVNDMKKDELVTLIKQFRGLKEESKKKEKKAVVKTVRTKEQLKAAIRLLKQQRVDAQEKHDKKSAEQLRRRIGRLKKMTRRFAAG